MDLEGVERLDLATFGGVDTVTIGDLSGTDVTRRTSTWPPPPALPTPRTTPSRCSAPSQADRVDVTADGGAVEVTGLAAQTSVTGGDPTDRLLINTLGGDDSVTVSDSARALLTIQPMTSRPPPRRSP